MGSRILLADDSITIQKVVAIIFANEDCELTVVDNGDAALLKAREINPDIVLVDALMPGKNGYEVCQELRRDPVLKNVALLLMTGAFEAFDEDKARQCGADDFITKPFESQNLIDSANRLIAAAKERTEAPEAAVEASVATPEAWNEPEDSAVPPIAEEFAAAPEEVVSPAPAAAGDDIWGVFDLDETPGAEAVAVDVAPAEEVDASWSEESEEPFDFAEETPEAALPQDTSGFEPVGEQEFAYSDTKPAVDAFAGGPIAFSDDVFAGGPSSFSEDVFAEEPQPGLDEAFAAEPASIEDDLFVAEDDVTAESESFEALTEPAAANVELLQEGEGIFAAEPAAESAAVPAEIPEAPVETFIEAVPFTAPVMPAVPVETTPAATSIPAAVTLDEEQLKALLAKVSREVIEKIVWEVVPDLAELLIKEEIKKLKAGALD